MIDVNVSLGRWPARRLPDDDPDALAARLRRLGVTEAWAGHFDALLHEDLADVNARLAEACRVEGLFRPFGAVNPRLPDWREDLRRCHEVHHMPGVRLHPDWHGYALDDPEFVAQLADAARRGLVVQVALKMEDERTLRPVWAGLPKVDPAPLADAVGRVPGLRLVVLNGLRDLAGPALDRVLKAGEVAADIAMLEGVAAVGQLARQVGASRLLLGSHAPFFVAESAHLKLAESDLTPEERRVITVSNARRLAGRFP